MKSQGKTTRKQGPNLRPKIEFFYSRAHSSHSTPFMDNGSTISSFFASQRKILTLTLFLKVFLRSDPKKI